MPADKRRRALRKRRRKYLNSQSAGKLITRSHRIAQELAEQFFDLRCSACSGTHTDENPLEVHHRDCNPLNNTLTNLAYLCKACHAKAHKDLPNVNAVSALNSLLTDKQAGELNEDLLRLSYQNLFPVEGLVSVRIIEEESD